MQLRCTYEELGKTETCARFQLRICLTSLSRPFPLCSFRCTYEELGKTEMCARPQLRICLIGLSAHSTFGASQAMLRERRADSWAPKGSWAAVQAICSDPFITYVSSVYKIASKGIADATITPSPSSARYSQLFPRMDSFWDTASFGIPSFGFSGSSLEDLTIGPVRVRLPS